MITKFKCSCGNDDPKLFHEYMGSIGYEAIVCTLCGRYYDEFGEHTNDPWSIQFVVKSNDKNKGK